MQWSQAHLDPMRAGTIREISAFLAAYLQTTEWGLETLHKIEQGQQPALSVYGFGGLRRGDFRHLAEDFSIEAFDGDAPAMSNAMLFEALFMQGKFKDKPEKWNGGDDGISAMADEHTQQSWRDLVQEAKNAGIKTHGMKRPAIEAALAQLAPPMTTAKTPVG